MIEHIPELIEAGISSFKIEGRMKSAYYTAIVTNAYRHAIDQALSGQELDKLWVEETNKVSHRPYCTGFYYGYPGQHYAEASYFTEADVAAIVESCDEDGNAVLTQRNKFTADDELELIGPELAPVKFKVEHMYNEQGEEIFDTRHAMMKIHTKLPCEAPRLAIVRKCR
jgi:putative protease